MRKGIILISRSDVLRLIDKAEEMSLRYDDFAWYLKSEIENLETVKNTNAENRGEENG